MSNQLDFEDPFWSVANEDGTLEKTNFFPSDPEQFDMIGGVEDFLQHNKVFINGITGNTAHSDSYMTIVDYDALEKALNAVDDKFKPTKEDWKVCIDYWKNNVNMQPPLRLVSAYIGRRYK